jgi:hypothetical protein
MRSITPVPGPGGPVGGLLLGVVSEAVLIRSLVALLVLSSITVWRHAADA